MMQPRLRQRRGQRSPSGVWKMKQAMAAAPGLPSRTCLSIRRIKFSYLRSKFTEASLYSGDGGEYWFIAEIKETDAGGVVHEQVQPLAFYIHYRESHYFSVGCFGGCT